jgi:hypothetical protein
MKSLGFGSTDFIIRQSKDQEKREQRLILQAIEKRKNESQALFEARCKEIDRQNQQAAIQLLNEQGTVQLTIRHAESPEAKDEYGKQPGKSIEENFEEKKEGEERR